MLIEAGATTTDAVEIARMEQEQFGDNRPLGTILVDHGTATPAAVEGALETQTATARWSTARSAWTSNCSTP